MKPSSPVWNNGTTHFDDAMLDGTTHFNEPLQPARGTDNPSSYGHAFNLIRAVQEYGPERVKQIEKRFDELEREQTTLRVEYETLKRLINAITN